MTRQNPGHRFQIDLFHAQLHRRGLVLVDSVGQPASDEEVKDLVEILVDPLGDEWPDDEVTKEISPTTQKNLLAAMAVVSDAG